MAGFHEKFREGDTIATISTGEYPGARCIIRLSGDESLSIAGTVVKTGKNVVPRIAQRGTLVLAYEIELPCTLLYFEKPSSFTGECVVEIFFPSVPFAARQILDKLCASGARHAKPGEFTFRAFRSRRLDIRKVEALSELLYEGERESRKAALMSLTSGGENLLESIRERLLDLAALVELGIDFSEEDVETISEVSFSAEIDDLAEKITKYSETKLSHGRGERLRIVFAGAANAGKSSLINALTGKDISIVSEIEGTTRDVLDRDDEGLGFAISIVDTPGITSCAGSHNPIAVAAESKRREGTRRYDIIVQVHDGGKIEANELTSLGTSNDRIDAVNKIDLVPESARADFAGNVVLCSALTGEGVEILRAAIASKVRRLPKGFGTSASLRSVLGRAKAALMDARDIHPSREPEVAAVCLRDALNAVETVLGFTTPDDVLDRIFSRFCIGK
ncbi:MAG: 50S ribosome-binding GTPase [Planctomycetes bacterium]|nr:50S ribosome-binding GTPase [Planctomycetota bacterium]